MSVWEEVIFIEVRENKYTQRNATKESDFTLRGNQQDQLIITNYGRHAVVMDHMVYLNEITDWNKITTIKMVISPWGTALILREYLTSGVADTEKQTEHE